MPEFLITDKEKTLLEALLRTGTLTDACRAIGIAKTTGSMRLRTLRIRYSKAKDMVSEYESYRSRLPSRYL